MSLADTIAGALIGGTLEGAADDTPDGVFSDHENGDLFDEDTGRYFDTLTLEEGLPASLGIYYNGYFYIFKPISRYRSDSEKSASMMAPAELKEKREAMTKEVLAVAADLDKQGKDLASP